MQGLDSPRSQEFELEARPVETKAQWDSSNGNPRRSSLANSAKSPTSPSRTEAHLNTQHNAAEDDARRILLRKHVPLVVLPDFEQKSGDSGSMQGDQEHGNTSRRGEAGENFDGGGVGRSWVDDERSHRSPSHWVATFFDVRPVQVTPSTCYVADGLWSFTLTADIRCYPRYILHYSRDHRSCPSPELFHLFRIALVELACTGDL